MQNRRKSAGVQRTLAGTAALAIGAAGAIAFSSPALAANIDESRDGTASITIHKYDKVSGEEGNQNPGGTGSNPTSDPLAGVVFELCEIPIPGINVGDNGSDDFWDQLRRLGPIVNSQTAVDADAAFKAAEEAGTLPTVTVPGIPDADPVVEPIEYQLQNCRDFDATDANGESKIEDLAFGAYYVREKAAPATVIKRDRPFVVSVPTPADNTNFTGEWIYDINVFPKNETTEFEEPEKNIIDQPTNGVITGKPITFEVTTVVPQLADGESYRKFQLRDQLDAKLEPAIDGAADADNNVSVTLIDKNAPHDKTVLVRGTDYVMEWVDGVLEVKLTTGDTGGLSKLNQGDRVVVQFKAKLKKGETGQIENMAFVNINDDDILTGGPGGAPNGKEDGNPSGVPNGIPSGVPNGVPSGEPNGVPNGIPNGSPDGTTEGQPNGNPSGIPNGVPNGQPHGWPSGVPHGVPTGEPNGGPNGSPDGSPTNVVESRWGAVEFEKVNVDSEEEGEYTDKLAGAEFHVYQSNVENGCLTADLDTLTQVMDGADPYVVTSGDLGKVSIPGLWVGDTEYRVEANGDVVIVSDPAQNLQARCYVLVEVKAPAGFILPASPDNLTEFIVTSGGNPTLDGFETITNKQNGVPELPLTGSSAQMFMLLGGIALAAVAGGVALVSRKRRNEGAEA